MNDLPRPNDSADALAYALAGDAESWLVLKNRPFVGIDLGKLGSDQTAFVKTWFDGKEMHIESVSYEESHYPSSVIEGEFKVIQKEGK